MLKVDLTGVSGGVKTRKSRDILPARYILTFLTFWGMCLIIGHRVCLNVALVAMVNSSSEVPIEGGEQLEEASDSTCPSEGAVANTTRNSKMGTYPWTPSIQGIILASYFYGYVVAQIVGGRLADAVGAKRLFGTATLLSSVLTCFTPLVSQISDVAVVVLRVILGLVHGMNYPCVYTLFSRWAPVQERSTLLSICVIGTHFGVVFSMPLTGYLCEYGFADGWSSAFYLLGGFGFVFCLLWMFLVFETPSDHPRISLKELSYIHRNTTTDESKQKNVNVPWSKIVVSPPVWAVTIAKFCGAWSFICFQSKLPIYLDEVLHLPIQKNGIVNSMLFGALCISIVLSGKVSDMLRNQQRFRVTTIRKTFETIALLGPACCMIAIPLVKCNVSAVVALLTTAMALFGLSGGGDVSVIVDMAPDFAGKVFGVSNAIASVPGILAPVVAGYFLEGNKGDAQQWSYIFYVSVGMYFIGAAVFLIFGSAEVQPWGRHDDTEQKNRTSSTKENNIAFIVPVILDIQSKGFEKESNATVKSVETVG